MGIMQMRILLAGMALGSVIILAVTAGEPETPHYKKPDIPGEFDHEAHVGLKAGCDACHVRRGSEELRDEPCAECHD